LLVAKGVTTASKLWHISAAPANAHAVAEHVGFVALPGSETGSRSLMPRSVQIPSHMLLEF
jgi:hypothetical protein